MPSTFTDALGLEKQATGENNNTWGTLLNAVLDSIDDAVAARLAKSVAGASDITLTSAEALHAIQEYTGTLTGNINVIVPASEKAYFVYNNTSGAFSLTVKTSAGTGIVVAQGARRALYCDGTNVVDLVTELNASADIVATDSDPGATAGPLVVLDRASGSPAIDDLIGQVMFRGRDATFNNTDYGYIQGKIRTPAAGVEDGSLEFYTRSASFPLTKKMEIADDTHLYLSDDGAAAGPSLYLDRVSASPAGSDVLGTLRFRGRNSTAGDIEYAKVHTSILVSTAGSESGRLFVQTQVAGTITTRLDVRAGVLIGSPLGGDPGVDGLNLGMVYQHGNKLLPRGHIDGLILSNNATDAAHDIDIAAGEAVDDGQNAVMPLSSTLVKQIDASWAVGTNQGGLDGTESVAGTPDADTWYHVWLIRRSDTGVVDALYSESATAPTMPTNYDEKRRIGAVLTDGSANIIAFRQYGDYFEWDDPQLDVNLSATVTTTARTDVISVPTGLEILAHVQVAGSDAATGWRVLVSSPLITDVAPDASNVTITGSGDFDAQNMFIRTNTSAQLRTRGSVATIDAVAIRTIGWNDPRGRDA